MEPRAAVGEYDRATGEYTLYTTSQNPHVIRLLMGAFVLHIPESKLRVFAPDVGGGFGSKIYHYAEEAIVTWAAGKVKRPVKWTSDRSEAFMSDAHGRDHVTKAELALDKDGKFLAPEGFATHRQHVGAYLSTFASSIPSYLYATLLAGQYTTPADIRRSPAPCSPTRRTGRCLSRRRTARRRHTCIERIVEIAAREMNLDRAEIRQVAISSRTGAFPYQTPVALQYDARQIPAVDPGPRRSRRSATTPGSRSGKAESMPSERKAYVASACLVLYRGLRNRALERGRRARCRRRLVGNRAEVRVQRHRLDDGLHRQRTATARGTRRPLPRSSPTGLGVPIDSKSTSSMATRREGADGHGHLRLALARRRRLGDRASAMPTRWSSQGQEDRRPPARSGRVADIEYQVRQVHRRPAPTRSKALVDILFWRLTYRTTIRSRTSSQAWTRRRFTIRSRTSPSPPAATSPRSRSIPTPA